MKKMKRCGIVFLCVVLLLSSVSAAVPFVDVKESFWYFDAVQFCYENELINGVSSDRFAPDDSLTRAMAVTILYRLEGQPTTSGTQSPFSDLQSDWYKEAVKWAYQNEVVNGTSETSFSPDDNITREQIAAILYRYAGSPKTEGNIDKFSDASSASGYAIKALSWAVEIGLINGVGKDQLAPGDQTTRAQFATMIMRYVNLVNHGCLRHEYSVSVDKEATCTEDGQRTLTCQQCGTSYSEKIPAGHDYKQSELTEPTCTENGRAVYICTKCGDSYHEGIPAKGHSWTNATCTEAKHCTVCGAEEGDALGHTTGYGTCGRCGEFIEMVEFPPLPVMFLGRNGSELGRITDLDYSVQSAAIAECKITITYTYEKYTSGTVSVYFYLYDSEGYLVDEALYFLRGNAGDKGKDNISFYVPRGHYILKFSSP